MKVIRILVLSVLAISGAFLYNGCGSDTTTNPPTTGTVNGKVVDGQGNPVPNITVVIGATSAISGSDGSFVINSVTTPYNAKLILSTGATPTGIVYQGITTFSPQLFAVGLNGSPSTAVLTVNIPAMNANQRATVIYTDNGLVHSTQTVSTSPAIVNVTWQNTAPVTGKVIVLVYTLDGTGNVTTYDKYGEKSGIALNVSGTSTITFAAADLNVTPSTQTLSGSINTLTGYNPPTTRMLLRFTSQSSQQIGVNIGNPVSGATFSFKVPGGLTSAPTFGLDGTSTSLASELSIKFITGTVIGTNQITLEAASTLGTPLNAATNIDTATNFTFSSGGTASGIYVIEFVTAAPTAKRFYLFTNSLSVTIPSFSAFGLPLGSGASYTWQVLKIGTIGSVNELVSSSLFGNSNFTLETVSSARTFTSAP